MDFDWVRLEKITLEAQIGIYPGEQELRQPLELELALAFRPAHPSAVISGDGSTPGERGAESLAESIDYAALYTQIAWIVQHGSFGLLESLAASLLSWTLLPPAPDERRGQAEVVRVRIAKPKALGGRALPSIEMSRDRSWSATRTSELGPGLSVEQTSKHPGCFVHRLTQSPGSRIPVPSGAHALALSHDACDPETAFGSWRSVAGDSSAPWLQASALRSWLLVSREPLLYAGAAVDRGGSR